MGIGRHRSTSRVRTGLLGASSALVLGVVGVTSGVLPGLGGDSSVDSHHAEDRIHANGAPSEEQSGKGSASQQTTPAPSASNADAESGSPSQKPSSSASTKNTEPTTTEPTGASEQQPERDVRKPPATTGAATPDAASGEGSAAEAAVLTLVNKERAQEGCQPVTRDVRLAGFAGEYSALMAKKGFFSHTTPDGRSPWDRAKEAGIDNLAAENIARGQADAEAVMKGWMNSPGHRANILNCDHRTMGVGAHFADGGPWWTQHFGR